MFVAEVLGLEPEGVVVPVIGGHSESTIVPVLSQAKPSNEFKPVTETRTLIIDLFQRSSESSINFFTTLGRNISAYESDTKCWKWSDQGQRWSFGGDIVDGIRSCQVYYFPRQGSHRSVRYCLKCTKTIKNYFSRDVSFYPPRRSQRSRGMHIRADRLHGRCQLFRSTHRTRSERRYAKPGSAQPIRIRVQSTAVCNSIFATGHKTRRGFCQVPEELGDAYMLTSRRCSHASPCRWHVKNVDIWPK